MNWKKFAALSCALSLLAALPAPEPATRAGARLEVTVGSPPLIALTFDDGPRSSTTGPLLDGLALREVPATFFLVGNRIPGNEELVRRMAAEGHQIGLHTYDHVELKGLSRQEFDLQVGKTRALITGLVGEGNYWLRPPYGLMDKSAAGPLSCGRWIRRTGGMTTLIGLRPPWWSMYPTGTSFCSTICFPPPPRRRCEWWTPSWPRDTASSPWSSLWQSGE